MIGENSLQSFNISVDQNSRFQADASPILPPENLINHKQAKQLNKGGRNVRMSHDFHLNSMGSNSTDLSNLLSPSLQEGSIGGQRRKKKTLAIK
jgi:hypothetical protein